MTDNLTMGIAWFSRPSSHLLAVDDGAELPEDVRLLSVRLLQGEPRLQDMREEHEQATPVFMLRSDPQDAKAQHRYHYEQTGHTPQARFLLLLLIPIDEIKRMTLAHHIREVGG